jgi:hypothetical protein
MKKMLFFAMMVLSASALFGDEEIFYDTGNYLYSAYYCPS